MRQHANNHSSYSNLRHHIPQHWGFPDRYNMVQLFIYAYNAYRANFMTVYQSVIVVAFLLAAPRSLRIG